MMYTLQVSIYTGLMLLIYLLLLRDRPIHRFNRFYLLSAAVLPVVLPIIKLPAFISPQPATPFFMAGTLPEMVITAGERTDKLLLPGWLAVIAIVYITVLLTIALVKISGYIKMQRIINCSDKEEKKGYTLLRHTGYGPGSWGRYIFLPEGDVDATIIRHEQVHIQLHHSRDIIFISCMQAIMWPNIFLHILKKELVQVHEFQADEAVEMNSKAYSNLLLSSVFKTDNFQLAHSFINHPIKRRIMMLHKNKTSGKLRGVMASLLAACLLTGIVSMQSCEQKHTAVKQDIEPVLKVTKKMPEAEYNVYEFMAETVKYPKEASEKGIEGRVLVRFVVDKDGKIKDVMVANKNADPLLAEAALAAVSKMPDWTPGEDSLGNRVSVYYTLPVTFKLDNENPDTISFKDLTTEENEEMEKMQRKIKNKRAEAIARGEEPKELKEEDAEILVSTVYTMLSQARKGYMPQAVMPDNTEVGEK